VQAPVTTRDELRQLTEGFNNMVSDINRLVKEVYERKLRERQAELSTLQSQMNPHFLYNTLQSVNMLAVDNRNAELIQVVSSLGKLLRYTVDNRNRLVRLRDELAFAEDYLHIQSLRLNDRIR
jgi:two-component system sensor histidine kinase YesM